MTKKLNRRESSQVVEVEDKQEIKEEKTKTKTKKCKCMDHDMTFSLNLIFN